MSDGRSSDDQGRTGYGEEDIRLLEGLEAVRLRPGMYIGSTGPDGLQQLVDEIVDNAVDEALAGWCRRVDVRLAAGEDDGDDALGDVVEVSDDGRGIPPGEHPEVGIPTPELVFTRLHAGGKFGGQGYKVSGGLHGVGASVVNALSSWLEVTVHREGRIWRERFEYGRVVAPLEDVGGTRRRGTRVRFRPDPSIFETTHFQARRLAHRLRELAYLNPGLTLRLIDDRSPEVRGARRDGASGRPSAAVAEDEEVAERADEEAAEEDGDAEGAEATAGEGGGAEAAEAEDAREQTFAYPGGIADYVAHMNASHEVLHDPVVFRDQRGDLEIEVAFQYNDGYAESINSYVNCIHTLEGGQHERGFRIAHTRVMNEYARRYGAWKKKENLSGEDVREGLMAVLSLRMTDAEFEGQTKTKLGNPEARSAVEEVVAQHLAAWLEENPKTARQLLERAARASTARRAARKTREAVRSGNAAKGRSSLDGKLTRCASRKTSENELFIVEGESAGGSAKQARDRKHQAILPLKGKPLNTEKASLSKVLSNKEIATVVQAIGAGIGAEFDLEQANYGRVIVLADADDDGAHIRCLLLTFFYRFMRPLLEAGRVYIAQPPLFKVERRGGRKGGAGKGKRGGASETKYAWSEEELDRILESWGNNVSLQRFKGLGEMDPEQLWQTTMRPTTRTLVRVTLDDAASAERQVSVLMGNHAEQRRGWILDNVRFGEEADAEARSPRGADEDDSDDAGSDDDDADPDDEATLERAAG